MSFDAVEAASPTRSFRAGWGWLLLTAAARAYLAFVLTLTACAVLPIVVGFSGSVVQSGSMKPFISPGDVVLSQALPARAAPPIGQVVTFPAPAGSAKRGFVLHRIVGANKNGSLVTAGDANADVDSTPLDRRHIISQARVLIPWIGLPAFWVTHGSFAPLVLWTLLTAVALLIEATRTASGRARKKSGKRRPPAMPTEDAGTTTEAPPDREPVSSPLHRIRTAARPAAVALAAILAVAGLAMVPLGQLTASFSAKTSTNGNSWTMEGPATKLAFTTDPSDSTGGISFGTQPAVALQDADGLTIISSVAPVALTITNPAGATLTCASNPKDAVSGVATFAGCKIDKTGTYTLRATSGSLAAATSASLTVTTGPAAQLDFATSPTSTTVNAAFAAQPAVSVQDAGGNAVPSSSAPITLSIPAGAALTCTANPKNAVSGVATFAGCKIDRTGTYSLTATSGTLTTALSATFTITDNPLGIFTVNQDIGSPGVAGSSTYSAGTYTVKGGGSDIWNKADQFQFLDRPMTGNGRLTAKVVSQSQTIPSGAAKAGVMFRQTLTAGSVHGMADMMQANGSEFHWRLTTGGPSGATTVTPGIAAPYWVRLTRIGNVLTAERSPNGTTWTQQGATQTVTMTSAINVGLAVSAVNNASLNTAVFDNVKLTTPPTAVAESYTTNEDTTLTVPVASGVLDNDSDPESDTLSAVLVSGTAGLTLNTNGSFTYVPPANFSGAASFTYKANDGVFDSNTVTVNLTVNPANETPSFTKGANQVVAKNVSARTVAGWATAISQGTGESGQVVDFIMSNNNNPLFSVQPKISATGTLTYTPATGATGVATVSASIHDNGGTANGGIDTSAVQTFTITVSGPEPVLTTTGTSLAYTENATTAADGGVTVTDVDSTNLTSATVRMTTNYVNGQDTLAFTTQNGITGTWTAATGVLALTGSATVANYQTALRSITYTNSSHAPTTATRTVSFTASDGTNTSTAATRDITVTSVNDAPVNSKPAGQATNKNSPKVFSTGNGNPISISDADAGTGAMQVQLVGTNGTTTLSTTSGLTFTVGDGTADATMTFTGSVTAVNTALAGLSFNPTTGFTGAASLQVVTSDQGNTGSGGTLTDDDTIAITVRTYAETIGAETGLLNYFRLGEATTSSDTFAGTTGSTLQSRSGEIGASWIKHAVSTADAVITSAGRIRKSGSATGGSSYYSSGAPGSADYTVEADVYVASLLTNAMAGVVGRVDTSSQSTGYVARYDQAAGAWTLSSVVNSNLVQLGSFSQVLTVGSTYRLSLDMTGSTIRLLVNGTQQISVVNAAITATGRGGVFLGFGAAATTVTDTTGMHLDNFTVNPPAADSKGANAGDYFGGPALGAAGAVTGDTAVQFDGVNDYTSVARQIAGDFSIEFWFKSTQGIGTDPRWSQGAGLVDSNITGTNNDFGVSLRSDGVVVAGVGGGTDTSIQSAAGYDDGSWHHVAFTRVQSTGVFKLYVDGSLAATGTNNTGLLTAQSVTTFGRLASGGNYYAGALDEIAMYSAALTQAQVTAHFNAH